MAVYGAVGWYTVCNCGTCIFLSDSLLGHAFHLYCNQNRSAILCKLMSAHDNLPLAMNSVNYFTMSIAIADLF